MSALDYLHSNDYIHHDIKCQNILVDRLSGNLKLGDLLSVEKLGNRKYFTKYIGTEEFISPEVKEGKYNFKADIYSFGLTLIQLLTIEKPYKEFNRKKDIYEAKINGKLPLSFNQIKNKEIKDFICLCLKEEKERPTCKELLKNTWLNDKGSPDHNSLLEIENNEQQNNNLYNNLKSNISKISDIYNDLSPFSSTNSLINLNKQSSNETIYSLDISRVNSPKKVKRLRFNSCNSEFHKNNESFKGVESTFSLVYLNDKKSNEINEIISNKLKTKKKSQFSYFKHRESIGFPKNKKKEKNNLITIYLYIIEIDYKLFMKLREKQEQNENILFRSKIIVSDKKWKKKKLLENEINIEYGYNGEKKNMEIIIENLKKYILLSKNNILLIKKQLNGKIIKIIKEKKIRDLKEKINKVIRNFKLLLNNKEFHNLTSQINNLNSDEPKLPKEITDKINIYHDKKINIENLFALYNFKDNEDFNNNYKLICQEYVILNIFDVDDT